MCDKCGQAPKEGEFFWKDGYWWHTPCANVDVFPRIGKLIPATIMTPLE